MFVGSAFDDIPMEIDVSRRRFTADGWMVTFYRLADDHLVVEAAISSARRLDSSVLIAFRCAYAEIRMLTRSDDSSQMMMMLMMLIG